MKGNGVPNQPNKPLFQQLGHLVQHLGLAFVPLRWAEEGHDLPEMLNVDVLDSFDVSWKRG